MRQFLVEILMSFCCAFELVYFDVCSMEKMKALCFDKLVTKRRCIKLFTLRVKVYSFILVWRACSACRRIP